ncbi:MAG TPA: transferrin receptor-like dimerization domain-containing protein [Gemmatimonadaceae bacterium]|nr:transferrin receptor-like dimerization domain-containing protein [Gemmatimonadaceae bacterium]
MNRIFGDWLVSVVNHCCEGYMRFFSLPFLASLGVLAIPLVAASPPPSGDILGFTPASSRIQRDWENKFRALPDPARMRADMKLLAARPHHVGSPYDKQNAEWILKQFKDAGWDAHIETFNVLFPTPKQRLVELVAPTRFTAKLQEPPVPGDSTSSQTSEQLPTYNAYSIDGDVTGPLVYVNYGIPSDYDELARRGVSVKGAIVIARYGQSWRGIKPKVAAEHGAIGCLIYSDPGDDGYNDGDVFPKGPMRPADGVQRGSVMDMPTYPGDPLTPGVGATKDAKRLALKDVKVLTKIPVLPISYGDAKPLLAAIGGDVAPNSWRGALPITYKVGPGPARVHLVVKSNWDMKPIYDVIGQLRGSSSPDEWVVRGNHHDAWVNGADDPIAGQVALLEEVRAMGALVKQGWHPKRTIIYAAWDGEEPGLLGSTEWAETHARELAAHAVAYLNSDTNGRGYLGVSGSHVLEKFINGVMRDITDPETGASVESRARARSLAHASAATRKDIRGRADLHIGALGSGSDYTAFLQHVGVPSMNLGFGGEDQGGVYHSVYDDFYWYTHFSDTSFVYGKALAQTAGTAVMRLADADVIPYDFTDLAQTVGTYVTELKTLHKTMASDVVEHNREVADSGFFLTNDPRHPLTLPKAEAAIPDLDFAPLDSATAALTRAAERYQAAFAQSMDGAATESFVKLNTDLLQSERVLLSDAGLPNRPWFKHLLYAPGYYTGYGVKTIPGVREAIEQKEWPLAATEIGRVSAALNAEAALVDRAATELGH